MPAILSRLLWSKAKTQEHDTLKKGKNKRGSSKRRRRKSEVGPEKPRPQPKKRLSFSFKKPKQDERQREIAALFTVHECPECHRDKEIRIPMKEDTAKSRKLINKLLVPLGEDLDMKLSLNNLGVCAFWYRNFCVVLEVPDAGDAFFLYTGIYRIEPDGENAHRIPFVMRKALELNYLQQGTRGAQLSLDATISDYEFTYSYSHIIMTLDKDEFATIVMNFTAAARDLGHELALVAEVPREDEILAAMGLPARERRHSTATCTAEEFEVINQ